MSKVISADGTTIAYRRIGAGPAVVLEGEDLAPLAELLAPHFTVYTYDRRGRGGSGDTPPYSIKREYEDLAAVIAEAGGTACVYGTAQIALPGAVMDLPITKLAIRDPAGARSFVSPTLVVDGTPRTIAIALLEFFTTKETYPTGSST